MPVSPTEAKVLAFFNSVTDAAEIRARIRDDPGHGLGPPRAYGVRRRLAERILRVRSERPGGRFTSVDEIASVPGVGPDTLHDIVHTLDHEIGFIPPWVVARFANATRLLVIAGAGVSAHAGMPTIQEWKYADILPPVDAESLAKLWSAQAFGDDIETVWKFAIERGNHAKVTSPAASHSRLAQLAMLYLGPTRQVRLVTLNQDRLLHGALEKAHVPTSRLVELHGTVRRTRCLDCEHSFVTPSGLPQPEYKDQPRYVRCEVCGGVARPAVLFFGEPYPADLTSLGRYARRADAVLVIGTSGDVRPPFWLALEARYRNRAIVLQIDPEANDLTPYVDHHAAVTAEGGLLALVDALQAAA